MATAPRDRTILHDQTSASCSSVTALARRIAHIAWFREPVPRCGQAERLATALLEHEAAAGLPPLLRRARLLDAAAGRERLLARHDLLERPAWAARIRERLAEMSAALRASGRASGHPLFCASGESLLLRPGALPVAQAELWQGLRGRVPRHLPPDMLRTLVDRVLWEVGGALGWELAGERLGPNPFVPLMAVYEEGFYPLDLREGEALLWSPAGRAG